MAPKDRALIARLLCGAMLTSVGLFAQPDIAVGQTPDTLALADAIAEGRQVLVAERDDRYILYLA